MNALFKPYMEWNIPERCEADLISEKAGRVRRKHWLETFNNFISWLIALPESLHVISPVWKVISSLYVDLNWRILVNMDLLLLV